MKTWSMIPLLLLLLLHVLATPLRVDAAEEASGSVHVKVHVHHKHKHHEHNKAVEDKLSKQLFHVTGSKAAFDAILSPSMRKELQLDVWRIRRTGVKGDELEADISATKEQIDKLQKFTKPVTSTKDTHAKKSGQKNPLDNHHEPTMDGLFHVKQPAKSSSTTWQSEEQRVAEDRKEVAECLKATEAYTASLLQGDGSMDTGKYVDSAFFDCFRPYDQILAFFESLVDENPTLITKIHNVSTTYEGLTIDGYKISTTTSGDETPQDKQALYTQSLIHAREWQGGMAHFYALASFLDGLRNGDANTVALFDQYDWYFVPIVNIDGYKYSWQHDRYWRVSRHASNGYDGVDLNRNFPPQEFFNMEPETNDAETNPGAFPLSEPETQGIYDFVMNQIPLLRGLVDIHAYAGMVLRPFSDIHGEPEEPFGSAMKTLGDAVRDAMSPPREASGFQYISQPSGELYPAYGCADDAFFRAFNFTVPALTIEVEGSDFIAKQQTIRKIGQDMENGLRQFAKEVTAYTTFVEKLPTQ